MAVIVPDKRLVPMKWLTCLIVLVFAVATILLVKNAKSFFGLDCNESNYARLNPLVVCDEKQVVDKRNYVQFKSELVAFIQENKGKGNISSVSLYFRDLQYGPTFGIDEYEQYSPASLLKLPMLLAYLTLYEKEPSILDTKVYYQNNPDHGSIIQSIVPKKTIREDTPYSIEELLEYMIKYSDNKSYYVLLEYLSQISPDVQLLRETFIDLGIIDPRSEFEDTISVKSYAGIFTQLFNSTYFSNKATSELALELLSDTDFTQGIVAGIPAGIPVAHKFGERYDESTGVKQLHDCGIVYYPDNPYLLCIMARGDDIGKLEKLLSHISKMVYEEFDSRKLD